MPPRNVTVIALLQMGALLFGVLFVVVFRKIGLTLWDGQEPMAPILSSGYVFATRFIRYGVWLGALLVIAWTAWAARPRHSAFPAFFSGVFLFVGFVFLTLQCCVWASNPLGTLRIQPMEKAAPSPGVPPHAARTEDAVHERSTAAVD